jgi:signal transduction histidine kinase
LRESLDALREANQHKDELMSELRDADRRKDEFLATLAHELRNPLSPISNALQVWPLVENDPEQLERLRGVMERQVRQIIRLIDDLMDVSRISRGRIQLQKQRVDLRTVISEAIESVQPLIDAENHRVTIALPAQPLFVDGDVARLTQVFGNVLHNAVKYAGRTGVIWIAAERRDGQAAVSIRDNGPGIPKHMLSQIFEM